MSPELEEQISHVKKQEWVDLQGLINCVMTHLGATSQFPGNGMSCRSISLLGRGTYNTVYQLEISDGSRLAASISNLDEETFDPRAKRSEIETMKFVRESGLYPDIPVPKVFAWDTTFTNPVCAPYVLMELVSGRTLNLNDLSQAQQLSVVKLLARLQASLSKPVPFDQIGSITARDEQHLVGPLMTLTQNFLGGPYKSIQDLWRAQLESQILRALAEWCSAETDLLSPSYEPQCTPQLFSELFQLLSSLIPHFQPPNSYLPLVLHHPDIALRNILFDESSISSGDLKMTGLIDWGGAQILPLMFTAKYPDDLRTTGEYPFEKPGWNYNEDWYTVPCDWTSTGDPSQWPKAFGAGHEPVDYTPRVRTAVSKFYLRTYFSACYAENLHVLRGDADLGRATLFRDAVYYMKFHEVVCGGWKRWVQHKTWIRETYWRLRPAGHGAKVLEELVIGPNMYRESVEEPVRDLGISGEYPVIIEYELDSETFELVPKGSLLL